MAERGEQMKYHRGGDRVIGPGAAGMARRSARVALRVESADERAGHRTPSDPIGRLGSGFAQQRDRDQDDVAFDLAQFLVTEPEPARERRRVTLEHEVALLYEFVGEFPAARSLDVEVDRFL